MNKYIRLLRYDWPMHFVLLFTNWLPDNVFFLRLRGRMCSPFFCSCGRSINIGRNVTFHNPSLIHLGNMVHISYGCIFMATDQIMIEDEVMFGPYCALVSGNHTRMKSVISIWYTRINTNSNKERHLGWITCNYNCWCRNWCWMPSRSWGSGAKPKIC